MARARGPAAGSGNGGPGASAATAAPCPPASPPQSVFWNSLATASAKLPALVFELSSFANIGGYPVDAFVEAVTGGTARSLNVPHPVSGSKRKE